MQGEPFVELLTGQLSSLLVWEQSRLCACTQSSDGSADQACLVCAGKGRYFDPPSQSFRAGLTGLSARALEAYAARFGPGVVGDAQVSIPPTAPCYERIGSGDRLLALETLEIREWSLAAGDELVLPLGAEILTAAVRSGSAMVPVTPPEPDVAGKITVDVPTRIEFQAPRRYEVTRELAHVRAFVDPGGVPLPKKFGAKLLDWAVR